MFIVTDTSSVDDVVVVAVVIVDIVVVPHVYMEVCTTNAVPVRCLSGAFQVPIRCLPGTSQVLCATSHNFADMRKKAESTSRGITMQIGESNCICQHLPLQLYSYGRYRAFYT